MVFLRSNSNLRLIPFHHYAAFEDELDLERLLMLVDLSGLMGERFT